MVKQIIQKVRKSAHFKLVTIPKDSSIKVGDYVRINKIEDQKGEQDGKDE